MTRKATKADIPKRKPGRPRKDADSSTKKPLKVDEILRERAKNPLLSLSQQAKFHNVSKQAIHQLLKRHGVHVDSLEEYKKHRADLFAGKQEMVLHAIDEDVVKKWTDKAPMAAVTLFNSLFNNERLERGQSTSNAAVVIASACRSSLEDE